MKKCLALGTVLLLLCNTALAEPGTITQRTFKTWKVEGSTKTTASQEVSASQWKKNLAAKAAEKQNAARRAQIAKENVQPVAPSKAVVPSKTAAPAKTVAPVKPAAPVKPVVVTQAKTSQPASKANASTANSKTKINNSKNDLKSAAKARRQKASEKIKTETTHQQRVRWEAYAKNGIKGVTGDAIVKEAAKYKGIKYVFGGTTPKGFDCSGYVQYVFKKHNANLTRTADTQAREGVFVTQRQLKPGDLVFFSTYEPGASHVGIYAGNGNFWSATSSRGIWLCGLHEDYWRTRYYGARRVLVTNGEPK